MQQNLLSQKNSMIIVGLLVLVLGGGYVGYTFWKDVGSSQSTVAVDPSLLSPDLAAFYAVKDKISLSEKDMAFTKKTFYSELEDRTVEIPTVEPTGRPNPFWAP